MNSLVININGKPVTTSRKIAEKFGKRHKHVLEAIKNLDCSKEFNETNFRPVEYTDAKGEKRPEYIITRDGFTFLVMGFTGKVAAAFKEEYIAAFNKMEESLKGVPAGFEHLFPYTDRDHQVQSSKTVNAYILQNFGLDALRKYNTDNIKKRTRNGWGPREILKWAKENGFKAKERTSAKEVMRRVHPEKAACMDVADELVAMGGEPELSIELSKQAEAPLKYLIHLKQLKGLQEAQKQLSL